MTQRFILIHKYSIVPYIIFLLVTTEIGVIPGFQVLVRKGDTGQTSCSSDNILVLR